jgi:hypothetical protein
MPRLQKYGKVSFGCAENISYGQTEGLDVILQLLIDDGVPSRGHRTNMFNGDFKVCGIVSGPHQKHTSLTVLDYAGGFVKTGEEDPMQRQMQEFASAEVDFGDVPTNHRGWQQKSQISVQGRKAVKTVTRTYNLADGSTKVVTVTQERQFN